LFENGSTQGGNTSWNKFSMDEKDWVHLCHVPAVAEQLFVFPCYLLRLHRWNMQTDSLSTCYSFILCNLYKKMHK